MSDTATIEIVTERLPVPDRYADVLKGLGIEGEPELVRKGLVATDLRVDEEERAVVVKITTDDIDRDGEIIRPRGVDLKQYRKNPIVLWAHDYDEPPLGKALWIKSAPDGKAVIAKAQFAKRPENHEGEWRPDTILDLYRQDVLRAVSIGFIPMKWHRPTPPEIKDDPRLAEVVLIYDKVLLLEFSAVPIPSNPEALAIAKGLDDADADAEDILERLGTLETAVDQSAKWYAMCERVLKDLAQRDREPEPEAPIVDVVPTPEVTLELDTADIGAAVREAFEERLAGLAQQRIDRARGLVEIVDE